MMPNPVIGKRLTFLWNTRSHDYNFYNFYLLGRFEIPDTNIRKEMNLIDKDGFYQRGQLGHDKVQVEESIPKKVLSR